MDLSNFNFDALNQATRDEMFAQLSYPVGQDFDLDPIYPMEATPVDWQPMAWQQPAWQLPALTNANAHAYNEPQGAIPSDFQGQIPSPTMLVEFHPEHNVEQSDKTYYNLAPWSGNVSLGGPALPIEGLSTNGLEPLKSHDVAAADLKRIKAQDLKRVEEARAANCCTWKDCPSTFPFPSDGELVGHLEDHASDVLQRWSGATECPWNGCTSRERFKILSPLKIHLQNAHVNPLLCVWPNCPFKRPFRNRHDLQRHVETKHFRTGEFRCPYKECATSIMKFKRKDKWLKHVQDAQHQLDGFCLVQHCMSEAKRGRFAGCDSPKEGIDHMFDEHTGRSLDVHDFSCAIGGCEHGDPPYLTKEQLREHLIEDHRCHDGVQDVVDAVEATEHHQLYMLVIPTATGYSPCKLCKPPPTPHWPVASRARWSRKPPPPQEKTFFEQDSAPRLKRIGPRTFSIVYCCECNYPSRPEIDLRCVVCPTQHRFCSDCTEQRIPFTDDIE